MSTLRPASTVDPLAPGAAAAIGPEREWQALLHGGSPVRIRPLHAEDIELERRFIASLSPASRRFRFLQTIQSPSDALLKQLTVIDPATDVAFVALAGSGSEEREVGVARFSADAAGHDCEFAVTVSDEWQNKGLGTLLMGHLIDAARARGIEQMHSSDAADNDQMRLFAKHLHFQSQRDPDDARLVVHSVNLRAAAAV